MPDAKNRPSLKIVKPKSADEEASAPKVVDTAPVATKEAAEFARAVDTCDAAVPLRAAHLACLGAHVVDQAVAFFDQAAAHAAPGTFRRDVPPGQKSAQATRAWIEIHLEALRKKSAQPDAATLSYEQAKDLKQAVAFTGSELDRALVATKAAGLDFTARHADLLKTATTCATSIALPQEIVATDTVGGIEVLPDTGAYLFGCDVLCGIV